MNGRYSIRREPQALALPFGAGGVAALGTIALGAVGLLVPVSWLETISFQLYLDTITSAAQPPLGTTAKIVAALALAAFGALLGFVLAKAFGVVASDFSLADVIARLRGAAADDEEDAPELRAADRHPDAPARRPFSAARDIPARDWDDDGPAVAAFRDDDELVLDAQFEPLVENHGGPVIVAAPEEPVGEPFDPAERRATAWRQAHESIEDYDLAPPDLTDWEVLPAEHVDPVVHRDAPVVATPAPAAVVTAPVTERRGAQTQAPLDLSVARLDELIARLEAGLSRKGQPATEPVPETLDAGDARSDMADDAAAPSDDPAFPHDPALAAALATLRKMNMRAG